MVEVNTLPNYVDTNVYNNDRIKQLSNICYQANSVLAYEALRKAFNTDFNNQTWVSLLVYDLGLLDVFTLFNVPREEVDTIKTLVNYNFNPSRENFINFIKAVEPNLEFLVLEDDGYVELQFIDDDILIQEFAIGDSEDSWEIGDSEDLWVAVTPINFIFAEENLYLLQNYIPVGVRLFLSVLPPSEYVTSCKKHKKENNIIKNLERIYNGK